MQRLLQERDALSVVSDEVGAPTRAATIARVTAELVRKRNTGQAGPSGLYHLTASGETSGTALPAASPSGCAGKDACVPRSPRSCQGLPDRGAAAAEFAAQLRTAAAGLGRPAAGLGNRPARVLHRARDLEADDARQPVAVGR